MPRPLGQGARSTEAPAVLPDLLSAADLARRLNQPLRRVETYLRRYRRQHPDCFVRVDCPRRNESRYLYRVVDVWPALVGKLNDWRRTPGD
jgi:hypothetical protein